MRAAEGISQRMLTQTVRGLEHDGLVTRTVHACVPPKVEYELTPVGQALAGPPSRRTTRATTALPLDRTLFDFIEGGRTYRFPERDIALGHYVQQGIHPPTRSEIKFVTVYGNCHQ